MGTVKHINRCLFCNVMLITKKGKRMTDISMLVYAPHGNWTEANERAFTTCYVTDHWLVGVENDAESRPGVHYLVAICTRCAKKHDGLAFYEKAKEYIQNDEITRGRCLALISMQIKQKGPIPIRNDGKIVYAIIPLDLPAEELIEQAEREIAEEERQGQG